MIVMGVVAWLILNKLVVNNWVVFFGCAAVYAVLYFVLAYRFMMNQYERDTIMVPVKRALRKIRVMK